LLQNGVKLTNCKVFRALP